MVKGKFTGDDGKIELSVHFNPSEYTIVTDSAEPLNDGIHMPGERNERLSMQLVFDTYTLSGDYPGLLTGVLEREDVRIYTDKLAAMALRDKDGRKMPVTFSWGSVNFTGYIVSVSQRFTMFMEDGKPVRATVDVVMQRISGTGETGRGQTINWGDNSWKDTVTAINPRTLL